MTTTTSTSNGGGDDIFGSVMTSTTPAKTSSQQQQQQKKSSGMWGDVDSLVKLDGLSLSAPEPEKKPVMSMGNNSPGGIIRPGQMMPPPSSGYSNKMTIGDAFSQFNSVPRPQMMMSPQQQQMMQQQQNKHRNTSDTVYPSRLVKN